MPWQARRKVARTTSDTLHEKGGTHYVRHATRERWHALRQTRYTRLTTYSPHSQTRSRERPHAPRGPLGGGRRLAWTLRCRRRIAPGSVSGPGLGLSSGEAGVNTTATAGQG
eukprot:scaffold33672_cov70-Phaeocystis_antarctica.AAC.8